VSHRVYIWGYESVIGGHLGGLLGCPLGSCIGMFNVAP